MDWWNDRYLPQSHRNFEYLETFPTEEASLQELMVFLEEAIDIQERHFRLHWILNLAQFQSSMDLQAAVGEAIGDADPALVGRILISIKVSISNRQTPGCKGVVLTGRLVLGR